MSDLYLVIVEGAGAGATLRLTEPETYRLGRSKQTELRLEDTYCSNLHATITFEDGHWVLTDGDSHNGSYVNEFKINTAILSPGDRIRCGRTVMLLTDDPESPDAPAKREGDDGNGADAEVTTVETVVWLKEAAEGSEVAIKRLISMYHPRLRARIARKMDPRLRTLLEPEDILQHAYTEAFRRVKQFEHRGPGAFFQWLVTMADNKLADEHRAFRSQKRDIARESHDAGDVQGSNYDELLDRVGGSEPTPSQLMRNDEAKGLLLACMARLPDHYRQVLQLRFIEERPVAEVAQIMERGEGAIAMLCQRALKQLRGAMSEVMT